ncbi:MAG: hypothetical protein HZB66_02920, partial [Candidatus Aenigmarchaeota archaeon]|nr:hypothetical protein [Candidatus Aenigmarchaeota archaeon]
GKADSLGRYEIKSARTYLHPAGLSQTKKIKIKAVDKSSGKASESVFEIYIPKL